MQERSSNVKFSATYSEYDLTWRRVSGGAFPVTTKFGSRNGLTSCSHDCFRMSIHRLGVDTFSQIDLPF